MKVVAFISGDLAMDRIIDHLKLRFVAEKPPPSQVFTQVALMAAEERPEYSYLTKGSTRSELSASDYRAARKTKFLSFVMGFYGICQLRWPGLMHDF